MDPDFVVFDDTCERLRVGRAGVVERKADPLVRLPGLQIRMLEVPPYQARAKRQRLTPSLRCNVGLVPVEPRAALLVAGQQHRASAPPRRSNIARARSGKKRQC